MKKAPKVLTRMRLSCCWGDNLDVKELNDVVDYINVLENQCKKQKEVIDRIEKHINKYESIKAFYEYIDEDGYYEYNYDEDFKSELLDILKKEDN